MDKEIEDLFSGITKGTDMNQVAQELSQLAQERGYTVTYESNDPNDGYCVQRAFKAAGVELPEDVTGAWIKTNAVLALCDHLGIPYQTDGEINLYNISEPFILAYQTGPFTAHCQYFESAQDPPEVKPDGEILAIIWPHRKGVSE